MLSNRKMLNYSFNFFNVANNIHFSIFHEEHKTKTREKTRTMMKFMKEICPQLNINVKGE